MSLPAESDTRLSNRVHHDVNDALTAIIGQAQFLLREELNEIAKQRVGTIEQLARRIAGIVDELRQPTPSKRD